MVGVGINENVILSKAEVSTEGDKVSLLLNFTEKDAVKPEGDAFDQLAGDGAVSTGNGAGTTLRMFPPLAPLPETKAGAKKTAEEMAKEAMDILGERKNSLIQILACYTTLDKIKFSMFAGMESVITRETLQSKIVEEAVIKQCFTNLANQFVAQATPFFGKEDAAVRLLLVRQSKEKHYATFRERFVNDNPFVELAIVPLAQSKLKFTKYELDKGLNDGTPTAKSDADSGGDAGNSEAPADLKNMFEEAK